MKERFALTFYGNRVYFDDPTRGTFDIRDVAHSGAVAPRWGGHTNWEPFGYAYSMLQHGLWCAEYVRLAGGSPLEQLAGGSHDGAEAFICDLNTNAKSLCPEYRLMEDRLLEWMFPQMGLPVEWATAMPDIVKEADAAALFFEANSCCHPEMIINVPTPQKPPEGIVLHPVPRHPSYVKETFLKWYSDMRRCQHQL